GRWPVVLPGGRQPVLLGQALQGARSRAPRRRSALRLLDAASAEQPGSPADSRGAVPREDPRRVARGPGRPRHPGGTGTAVARLLRGPGRAPPRPGARVRPPRSRTPPHDRPAARLHGDADARSGPAADARPAHRRRLERAGLHTRRDRGATRAQSAVRPTAITYEPLRTGGAR